MYKDVTEKTLNMTFINTNSRSPQTIQTQCDPHQPYAPFNPFVFWD